MKVTFRDCNTSKKYGPYEMTAIPERGETIKLNKRTHWIIGKRAFESPERVSIPVVSWNPWS